MATEGLSRFLFEIASAERLAILEAVAARPRKHTEIARSLGITGSETSRHLNRLVAAGLVAKNLQGEYAATPLSEVLRGGLPILRVLLTHREYLQDHRAGVLDAAFLARLGELRESSIVQGAYRVFATQESALRKVERRIWVVTEQAFEQALPVLREKMAKGADVRVVRSRRQLEADRRVGHDFPRNFPLRTFPDVNLFLAVLDDQAGLCLPSADGRGDLSAMLLVTDPIGYRWSEELFLHLWNHADGARIPSGHDR